MQFWRFCLYLIILLPTFTYNVNAITKKRPTDAAVETEMTSCAPMFITIASIYLVLKSSMSWDAKNDYFTKTITTYVASYEIQEALIEDYINRSYVINHTDRNDDLVNDYAGWAPIDYINSDDSVYKNYKDKYDEGEKAWLRQKNVTYCPEIINDFPTITKTNEDGSIYYSYTFEDYTDIAEMFDGCEICEVSSSNEDCKEGLDIYGFTNELYNDNYKCDDGVLVQYQNIDNDNYDEQCISEGTCYAFEMRDQADVEGMDEYLVCAYEEDGMYCSEAVFCSFTLFESNELGQSEFDEVSSFNNSNWFNIDFSALDARTANGVSPHDGDTAAIVSCQSLIDDADPTCTCTTDQAQSGVCDYGVYHECSYDNITTIDTCEYCGDVEDCIDDGGRWISGCEADDNEVCGYYGNSRYLAHCAIREDVVASYIYTVPEYISKYCTGDAKIATGKIDFTGRLMRCIELTIQNMFFGAYETVDTSNNKIDGIFCAEDDTSVSYRPECEGGIFSVIQDYMKDAIYIALALSIVFTGILVIFGLISDLKILLRYVITIGIVVYFSISDGWRDNYYYAVVSTGKTIGIVIANSFNYSDIENFSSDVDLENIDDGCSFAFNDSGDGTYTATGPGGLEYSAREAHYAIWDLFDCKIQNFFTVMSGSDVGTLPFAEYFQILQGSFEGFFISIITVFILFIFIFIFIYFAMQFVFLALSAFFVITILVFISPLIFPLLLFKQFPKAKSIFDNWFKTLLGYTFQPIILFLILSFMMVFMDYALYGTIGEDVLEYNEETLEFDFIEACNASYLPCILYKVKTGYYNLDNFNDIMISLFIALTKAGIFLFVIFYMGVQAVRALSSQIFNADSLVDGSEMLKGALSKAASTIGKVGYGTAKRGAGMGARGVQRARGKKIDADYFKGGKGDK